MSSGRFSIGVGKSNSCIMSSLVEAINGMMDGVMDPSIAFSNNCSCLTHIWCVGFGVVVSPVMVVLGGHGCFPSTNPIRSKPIRRVWN